MFLANLLAKPFVRIEDVRVVRLPTPPFAAAGSGPVVISSGGAAAGAKTRLTRVASRPDNSASEQAWRARNSLETLLFEAPNGNNNLGGNSRNYVPPVYENASLEQAIIQPRTGSSSGALLLYGASEARGGGGRYVFGFNPQDSSFNYGFDFDRFAYRTAAERKTDTGGHGFTRQVVTWAEERGGVLYVSTAYNGYARESAGRNAYVSAVRISDGRLLWRSRALVANAQNFLVLGDVLVCGYGFSDEKDFLYLLDRRTGRIMQQLPVRSAPEWILRSGKTGLVHVKCYDANYVFRPQT